MEVIGSVTMVHTPKQKRSQEIDDHKLLKMVLPLSACSVDQAKAQVSTWPLSQMSIRRALAIHCLLQLFEIQAGYTVKKGDLFDDVKLYFESNYKVDICGSAEMGKLVKLIFNAPTKRAGSKSGAKYCYKDIKMKDDKVAWFDTNRPKKVSFIDNSVRFKVLIQPCTNCALDDMFEQFLYDQKFAVSSLDTSDHRLRAVSTMLVKSDVLLHNFMSSVTRDDILTTMTRDWNSLDIITLLKETSHLPTNAVTLISTFPTVLDSTSYSHFSTSKKDFLQRYYKIQYDRQRANSNKLKMVQFLAELFFICNDTSLSNFILNFKYVATTLLRHLSMTQKASFGSYWMLYCFLDEFIQFLLEFYCYKKSNHLALADR